MGRQLGATGETVRRNIRWIRDDRGISGAELSQAVTRLGRPIPLLGVQRIEAGTRRVDVDDLAAIAVALGVSPTSLLMPLRMDAGNKDAAVPRPGVDVQANDLVPVSGWHKPIAARAVWNWLVASAPLIHGTMSSFVQLALPRWERDRIESEMRSALTARPPIGGADGDD